MDKAPDFRSGDCRFESCHAQRYIERERERERERKRETELVT